MNTKLGRNDPCPCGSGKKYKHCHMGKPPEEAPTAEFPFPTVGEAFVLGPLLVTSQPFRKIYDVERAKIDSRLVWTSKLSMPPEIVAQAIRLPSSTSSVLYLRRIPAEATHALEIAHELLHLVLDAEGFPFLVAQSERTPLSALLNSLVQDPLISARLVQYNFDIEKKIQRDLALALASVQQAALPQDAATRRIWALNYASQLLECSVVTTSAVREQREGLQDWFRKHQPLVASEGEEFLAKAQALGYETPERMEGFFNWVVQHYNLARDFVITRR